MWLLKQVLGPLGYSAIEHGIESCIEVVYDLHVDAELKALVKHADLRALATEKRDLIGIGGTGVETAAATATLRGWNVDKIEPFTDPIVPLGQVEAYRLVMDRCEQLRP